MSIKAKLLFATTGLVLFLGIVLLLLVGTYLYDRLIKEAQEKGVLIGKDLAERCADPILTGDYYSLATLLVDQKDAGKSVDYAFVIDANGKVLADTFAGNFPVDLLAINPLNPSDKYRIASFNEGGRVYYDIAVAILRPPVGIVHLGIPEAPIRKEVSEIINPIIVIIIIALMLGTIAAFMFSQYITRPITMLADSVGAIRNGNFENKAIVHTKDEVGRLAVAFNEMVEELNVILKQLKDSETMFRLVSQSANDAVVMINHEGLITVWNEAAERLFGYTAEEAIGNEALKIIATEQNTEEETNELVWFLNPLSDNVSGKKLELQILAKNQKQIHVEVSISNVQVKGEWNAVGIIRDITQQKELEDRLTRLSYLDGLTNINNRRSFNEHIKKECKRAQREQFPLSMFMIDIDFFKDYNDTYGHNAGDECLIKVAEALKKSLRRPGDYLARYGGEEFAIIAPNTDKEGARKLAENIRLSVEALQIEHATSKVSKNVTCSIGIAINILDNTVLFPADLVVRQADVAMYRAKKSGRNRICIY